MYEIQCKGIKTNISENMDRWIKLFQGIKQTNRKRKHMKFMMKN